MSQTSLMPPIKTQFLDNNGNPAAGGSVYTWQAGTVNTAKATYTDSTGAVENSNPVILDSNGRAAIWLSGYYHIQAYDAQGNNIADTDNVSSMPNTNATQSEWVSQNIVLTYSDANNFTTPGTLTSTFPVGQRVKATVSAGTIYGTVSNSTAGGSPVVTTVTVTWDSGSLDSGLSAVWTGIINVNNTSLPTNTLVRSSFPEIDVINPANRTVGDIITETAGGTMGAIAAVAATQYLKSAGVASLPAYSKLTLSDTGIKMGTFTRSSSGTQNVTGIGYNPSVVLFLTRDTESAEINFVVGFDDGTSHYCMGIVYDGSGMTSDPNNSISSMRGTYDHIRGYISSKNSDGFDVAFTLTGTAAARVYYLALP